jgi:hypothetical protein
LDTILAKISADGSLVRFSRAFGKEMDHLKQLGFYVDVDDGNQVRATPAQITREIADDHLQLVRDILETLRSRMPAAQGITVR